MAHDSADRAARAKLERLVRAGRAAWPGVAIDLEEFIAKGSARAAGGARSLLEVAISADESYAADLFLAHACAFGHPVALAELDRHFIRTVLAHVSRLDAAPHFADEVAQRLREKLFLGGADSPPRIAAYGGRGPLAGWLRVVAVRMGRDVLRSKRRQDKRGATELFGLRSVGLDPELRYLQERYGRELNDAFARTMGRLTAKEKSMLSLYYLEGMSSAAIGGIYGVTGAAVRLWLKECREGILLETRRALAERVGLGAAELDSVLRLVGDQIDVSIRRMLEEP